MSQALPDTPLAPVLRGRPRDAAIDARALDAARHLLTTVGFDQTNIQSVARRARIGASTVYRRWPSRIELIEDAIYPGFDNLVIKPTGDVQADLRRFLAAYTQAFTTPASRAALPGLFAAYQSRDSSHFGGDRIAASMRPQFHAMLAAARPGSVDANVSPDDLLDLLVGAVMFKAMIEPLTPRAGVRDRTAELLDRVLAPRH